MVAKAKQRKTEYFYRKQQTYATDTKNIHIRYFHLCTVYTAQITLEIKGYMNIARKPALCRCTHVGVQVYVFYACIICLVVYVSRDFHNALFSQSPV